MNSLTLYYKPQCPYCQKVLNFLKINPIELFLKNTSEDHVAKADLLRIGGKAQVPCLMIKDVPLYESEDIIKYLQKL
jgi:glutathione S-transferase